MKYIQHILILVFGLSFIITAIFSSNNLTLLLQPTSGPGSLATNNFLFLGILGLIMVGFSIRNLIKGDNY